MKVAIVGATGLVGSVMLEVLAERNFKIDELLLVASEKSVGKVMTFKGQKIAIISVSDAIAARPDIALFSAGGSASSAYAPQFAEIGCVVIDNSSAWRMDSSKVLCVPEINGHLLDKNTRIIANPNCSTIQLVAALNPLHDRYGIKRLVISTYQSYTGTGVKAVDQYQSEKSGNPYNAATAAYPHPIFENCLPHCDTFVEEGYTKEEVKIVNETQKILSDKSIQITATAVRVPVDGGHSESVNIELKQEFDLDDVKQLLSEAPGVTILDNVQRNVYPTPLYAKGKDDVFVGRIRRDKSIDNGLNLWVVSDNLRKGAATNAIQIAEYLLEKGIVE